MPRLISLPPLAFLAFCASAVTTCVPQPAPKPTLLVFFTIDQMLPEHLDRYAHQYTGGLARLRGGAIFTDAHQDHAITETAPGHASTMSGRFPQSTGITRNIRGVGDPDSPLIDSADLGASPRRFRGTTLTDWLTAVNPATRALSVSKKDRGAILPIGRSKQQIYWFPSDGIFTTSSWYADSLPSWVNAFNARRVPHRMAGKQWVPLLPAQEYTEPDSVPVENLGKGFLFPHRFPVDSVVTAKVFRDSPMMDEHTLQFALEGVRQLDLGRGPGTDVLAISLSNTDAMGHLFGPESKEMHDQLVRLDRYMGVFIDSLYKLRDSSTIIFALTADHGVAPIPELAQTRFLPPPRRVDMDSALAVTRLAMRAAGGDTDGVDFESGGMFLKAGGLANGAKLDSVLDVFIAAAKRTPGVMRVDRYRDLPKRDLKKDQIARRWLQMFSADLEPEAVVTLHLGSMYTRTQAATHGSPHDYDTHVPLIFYGLPFKPGRYPGFVRVIDVGPTLAKVLGVDPTEPVDGRPLVAAIR